MNTSVSLTCIVPRLPPAIDGLGGLLPVSPRCNTSLADGIKPGKHYWIPSDKTTGLKDLVEVQEIADNAYTYLSKSTFKANNTQLGA
jgi:hypothetical protein